MALHRPLRQSLQLPQPLQPLLLLLLQGRVLVQV